MKFYPEYNYLVTWQSLVTTSAGYLLLVFTLRKLMKNRKAMDLTGVMRIYNAIQVVLSALMVYGLGANFSLSNPFALNVEYTAAIEAWMIVHHLSKILDFCDTIFMVLRKRERQLNFLHLWHHFSVVFIWGFLLQRGDANGTSYFGGFVNAAVHTAMYAHYLWTSFGLTNPLKVVITNMQILQFWITLGHVLAVLAFEKILPSELAYIQLFYQSFLLYLFSQFKKRTYGTGNKAGDIKTK